MPDSREFTTRPPKPLPVIVLADVSASMGVDGKIDALNRSIEEMARDFASSADFESEIHVAVVAYGGTDAWVAQRPIAAADMDWKPLTTGGKTPLGRALALTTDVLEDRQQLPSRSYRPTLILVSDGRPTDSPDWETQLERLLASERASKGFRFAIAIGADCQRDMLERFVGDSTGRVFEAHEANQISEFFQLVTMTVTRAVTSGTYTSASNLDLETISEDDLDA